MTTAIKSAGGVFVKSRGGVRADKYAHYYGRANMGVTAHEGKMFLFGGKLYNGDSLLDSVDMGDLWYSTDGSKWTLRPTICVDSQYGLPSGETITPRRNPAIVSRRLGLYIYYGSTGGGWHCGDGIGRVWSPFSTPYISPRNRISNYWNNCSGHHSALNKIYSYWSTSDGMVIYKYLYTTTWAAPTPSVFTSPTPPIFTAIAELNGSIYITGGQRENTRYNNTYVTSNGLDFTRISGNYTACSKHIMLSLDNALYIIAYIPTKGKVEVWKSTNGATWWTKLTNSPEFGLRYDFSGCVFDGKLWVMGGRRVGSIRPKPGFADVWNSTDGVTWTEVTRWAPWGRFV